MWLWSVCSGGFRWKMIFFHRNYMQSISNYIRGTSLLKIINVFRKQFIERWMMWNHGKRSNSVGNAINQSKIFFFFRVSCVWEGNFSFYWEQWWKKLGDGKSFRAIYFYSPSYSTMCNLRHLRLRKNDLNCVESTLKSLWIFIGFHLIDLYVKLLYEKLIRRIYTKNHFAGYFDVFIQRGLRFTPKTLWNPQKGISSMSEGI
jgi:hypothetical protein